jgi:hypothetical protein
MLTLACGAEEEDGDGAPPAVEWSLPQSVLSPHELHFPEHARAFELRDQGLETDFLYDFFGCTVPRIDELADARFVSTDVLDDLMGGPGTPSGFCDHLRRIYDIGEPCSLRLEDAYVGQLLRLTGEGVYARVPEAEFRTAPSEVWEASRFGYGETLTSLVDHLGVMYSPSTADGRTRPSPSAEVADAWVAGTVHVARTIELSGELEIGSQLVVLVAAEEIRFDDVTVTLRGRTSSEVTGGLVLIAPRFSGAGTIDAQGRDADLRAGDPEPATRGGFVWFMPTRQTLSDVGGRVREITVSPSGSVLDVTVLRQGGTWYGGQCTGPPNPGCRDQRYASADVRVYNPPLELELETPTPHELVVENLISRTFASLQQNTERLARVSDPTFYRDPSTNPSYHYAAPLHGQQYSYDGQFSRQTAQQIVEFSLQLCDMLPSLTRTLASACSEADTISRQLDEGRNWFGYHETFYNPLPPAAVDAFLDLNLVRIAAEQLTLEQLIARWSAEEDLDATELRTYESFTQIAEREREAAEREVDAYTAQLQRLLSEGESTTGQVQSFAESIQTRFDAFESLIESANTKLRAPPCEAGCILTKFIQLATAVVSISTSFVSITQSFATMVDVSRGAGFNAQVESLLKTEPGDSECRRTEREYVPGMAPTRCPGSVWSVLQSDMKFIAEHASDIVRASSSIQSSAATISAGLAEIRERTVRQSLSAPDNAGVFNGLVQLASSAETIFEQRRQIELARDQVLALPDDAVLDRRGALSDFASALTQLDLAARDLEQMETLLYRHVDLMLEVDLLGQRLDRWVSEYNALTDDLATATCRLGLASGPQCNGVPVLGNNATDERFEAALEAFCINANVANDDFLEARYLAARSEEFARRVTRVAVRDGNGREPFSTAADRLLDLQYLFRYTATPAGPTFLSPLLNALSTYAGGTRRDIVSFCAAESDCENSQLAALGVALSGFGSPNVRRVWYGRQVVADLLDDGLATFQFEQFCGDASLGFCAPQRARLTEGNTGVAASELVRGWEIQLDMTPGYTFPGTAALFGATLTHSPYLSWATLGSSTSGEPDTRSISLDPGSPRFACEAIRQQLEDNSLFFGDLDCEEFRLFEASVSSSDLPLAPLASYTTPDPDGDALTGSTVLGEWTLEITSTLDSLNIANQCYAPQNGLIKAECLPEACMDPCYDAATGAFRTDADAPLRCSCFDNLGNRIAQQAWEQRVSAISSAACPVDDGSRFCSGSLEDHWCGVCGPAIEIDDYSTVCGAEPSALTIRPRGAVRDTVDARCEVFSPGTVSQPDVLGIDATCVPFMGNGSVSGMAPREVRPAMCNTICGPLCRRFKRSFEGFSILFFTSRVP